MQHFFGFTLYLSLKLSLSCPDTETLCVSLHFTKLILSLSNIVRAVQGRFKSVIDSLVCLTGHLSRHGAQQIVFCVCVCVCPRTSTLTLNGP